MLGMSTTVIWVIFGAIVAIAIIAAIFMIWRRKKNSQVDTSQDNQKQPEGVTTTNADTSVEIKQETEPIVEIDPALHERGQEITPEEAKPEMTEEKIEVEAQKISVNEKAQEKPVIDKKEEKPINDDVQETFIEANSQQLPEDKTEPEGEHLDVAKIIEENIEDNSGEDSNSSLAYNIGKSGKRYTEEELDLLIKE